VCYIDQHVTCCFFKNGIEERQYPLPLSVTDGNSRLEEYQAGSCCCCCHCFCCCCWAHQLAQVRHPERHQHKYCRQQPHDNKLLLVKDVTAFVAAGRSAVRQWIVHDKQSHPGCKYMSCQYVLVMYLTCHNPAFREQIRVLLTIIKHASSWHTYVGREQLRQSVVSYCRIISFINT